MSQHLTTMATHSHTVFAARARRPLLQSGAVANQPLTGLGGVCAPLASAPGAVDTVSAGLPAVPTLPPISGQPFNVSVSLHAALAVAGYGAVALGRHMYVW